MTLRTRFNEILSAIARSQAFSRLRSTFEHAFDLDEVAIAASSPRRHRTAETARCLEPFLKAMHYRGSEQQRYEAVPHFQSEMDITDLRAALVNLGYTTEARPARPADIDPRLLPCLHECAATGEVMVLLSAVEGQIFAFVRGAQRQLHADEAAREGVAYFPATISAGGAKAAERESWSKRLMRRFNPYLTQLITISALSNVLSIVIPLFVMAVYDRVIAAHALSSLPMLIVGVFLAMAVDLYLKFLRATLFGELAGRIDYLIGTATFAKLMRLPLSYTDGSSVTAQVGRLREFQAVRDLLAGPGAAAIVDFPFTIVSLAVIAIISNWLVLVPLVSCAVFALSGYVSTRWLQPHERAQSAATAQLFHHVTDTTLHHESIKREGGESVWLYRFRLMSASAATQASRLQNRNAAVEAWSMLLNNLAALAVLAFGTLMVLVGSITVGALIATMALTWRILSPAQQLFQVLGRLDRLRSSIRSMDQLLALTDEHDGSIPNLARAPKEGRIVMQGVSLRHGRDSSAALVNINLSVPAGKMLAITGANGAGKSSLLRVIQGLHLPANGMVSLDGVDIRQLPPAVLRRSIGCAPQKIDLFYGTIAQNLRLGDPLASDEAMRAAAADAGILSIIESLPERFDTRIGDASTTKMPPGFLRQLTIARALIRPAPILVMDEPEAMLDDEGARAIQAMLENIKGKRTVIFVSHRPSYIRVADFAVAMRGGGIEFGGKPDAVIERLLSAGASGKAA